MKKPLLLSAVLVILSLFTLSVKADTVVDTSNCQKIYLGSLFNGGFIEGLSCPHLAPGYIVYFVQMDMWSNCAATAINKAYRVTGSCTAYTLYRIN